MKVQPVQFVIVQGVAHEEGPGLALLPDLPVAGATGLYAVAEASPSSETALCHDAIQTLVKQLHAGSSSLTAALGNGILAVHDELRARNSRSLSSQQARVGMSCIALREDELYFVQAGPSLAFHWRAGSLERLSLQRPEAGLGGEELPGVEFHRRDVKDGDIVLLVSTSLPQLVALEALPAALALGADEAARRLYLAARGQPHFAAIFLAFNGEKKESQPKLARPAPRQPRQPVWKRLIGTFLPGHLEDKPFSLLQKAPSGPTPPVSQPHKGPSSGLRLLRIGLLFLALALAVSIVGSLGLRLRLPVTAEARPTDSIGQILLEADRAREAAQHSAERTEARAYLQEALKLAAEAVSLAPNDQAAISLRQALATDLATLDSTYQLSGLRLITNFAGVGPAAPLLRLAVSSGAAYILGQDGRLLRYPLDASARNGSTAKGPTTQEPSAGREGAITPIQQEEGGGAFFLDGERRLFRYDGPTVKAVPLRGANDWLSFQAVASSEGNFYVLDSRASQVWRYLPTDDGYDSERRGVLKGAQLVAATDLAIAGGEIYILETGGRVRRFTDGRESPFPQSGLAQPLLDPRRIMVGRRSQRVYVVDSGQRRIVAFSPDGAFIRQLTEDTLDSLQDASIDEAGSKVYLITQSGLYEANLPP